MKIAVYTISTGQIQRVVDCAESDVPLQAQDGEAVLVGDYADIDFYIENGIPVPIPLKPSEHHIFDYTTKQWVDPRTPETEWLIIRSKRNRLLQNSDWTQLPDVPLETKEAWTVYRQQLRDVTDQPDPFNIVWPTPPN